MFTHLSEYPGDPILTLNENYLKDSRPNKVNLSIGIYFDENGDLPLMEAVRAAEHRLVSRLGAKPYQPMEGVAAYTRAVQELLFGADHAALAARRVATVQTVGSCGALRLGADFLRLAFPDSQVWVSDPTWENHSSILRSAGMTVNQYPYYDSEQGGIRFGDMLSALEAVPAQSVVLLHACCHNPTGEDLSEAQWQSLIELMVRRRLIPFLDLAYQGFGDGLEADAAPIRALADTGLSFLVANSFSKNMGVYGERGGALSIVCPDTAQAERVLGQLKSCVRQSYSNPPMHAALLVSEVLGTPELRTMWAEEVEQMRLRILAMRHALHDALKARLPERDFSYVLRQRGMFSYTGLSQAQVNELLERHAIYLVRSGRLCIPGLNPGNVGVVAEAMAAVLASDTTGQGGSAAQL
ncbi:MAG: aspartate/tyrosine/aromatic aminotransferase [Pigmentiphaga sp.]|nr:aspartate/tyrosine/aromatic aminotransferase [Pigmentiphaga sp.]